MKTSILILLLCAILGTAGCSGDSKSSAQPCIAVKPKTAPAIGREIPDITLEVLHNEAIKPLRLSAFRGKWLILFFYPADFTFVCPTELRELSENYDKFRKAGAEIISISTDSVYVHRAWKEANEDIRKIPYPMASDRSGALSRLLGVYDEGRGISLRASFVINPQGRIAAIEMHEESIGRSAAELLRKLEAAVAVSKSDGGFCPANWTPGKEMIKPK